MSEYYGTEREQNSEKNEGNGIRYLFRMFDAIKETTPTNQYGNQYQYDNRNLTSTLSQTGGTSYDQSRTN